MFMIGTRGVTLFGGLGGLGLISRDFQGMMRVRQVAVSVAVLAALGGLGKPKSLVFPAPFSRAGPSKLVTLV